MKLNRQLELAINAVNALKNEHKPVRTQDVALKIGATTHFLEQIMRKLRVYGIVASVRGPGGGYTLAQPSTPITTYDVALAVGHSFVSNVSEGPTTRLNNAVIQAYLSTTI
jgi:Rrf2 family transcriptional regulator, iron-sulfur cluster assembly transcription factor